MIEFQAWPKTPRLFRDMTVTEKIDGTNAAIHIQPVSESEFKDILGTVFVGGPLPNYIPVRAEDQPYLVTAQSRKRLITPEQDNFGFAAWVRDNAADLAAILGPGVHYGEWWGSGIQRGYGLPKGQRAFSLFNVNRYAHVLEGPKSLMGLEVVPVIYRGPFDTATVQRLLSVLKNGGSYAAPGFDRPEGLIVHHSASNSVFKVTIENDERPKGE